MYCSEIVGVHLGPSADKLDEFTYVPYSRNLASKEEKRYTLTQMVRNEEKIGSAVYRHGMPHDVARILQ